MAYVRGAPDNPGGEICISNLILKAGGSGRHRGTFQASVSEVDQELLILAWRGSSGAAHMAGAGTHSSSFGEEQAQVITGGRKWREHFLFIMYECGIRNPTIIYNYNIPIEINFKKSEIASTLTTKRMYVIWNHSSWESCFFSLTHMFIICVSTNPWTALSYFGSLYFGFTTQTFSILATEASLTFSSIAFQQWFCPTLCHLLTLPGASGSTSTFPVSVLETVSPPFLLKEVSAVVSHISSSEMCIWCFLISSSPFK